VVGAAIVISLGLSFDNIFLPLVVGFLLLGAMYAIAQGGRVQTTPAEATHRWASDTLALPFWVEVAANFVEWMAIGSTAAFLGTWSAPISATVAAFVFLGVVIVALLVAIASAALERRAAKRALQGEVRRGH
jgi:hypothetical protein